MLTGQPGAGKTSLMARMARRLGTLQEQGYIVLQHYAGLGHRGFSIRIMLRRFCRELAQQLRVDMPVREVATLSEVSSVFRELCRKAVALYGANLVVLCDGYDQMQAAHRTASQLWLPVARTVGLVVALSLQRGCPAHHRLLERVGAHHTEVQTLPLDAAACRALADRTLRRLIPRARIPAPTLDDLVEAALQGARPPVWSRPARAPPRPPRRAAPRRADAADARAPRARASRPARARLTAWRARRGRVVNAARVLASTVELLTPPPPESWEPPAEAGTGHAAASEPGAGAEADADKRELALEPEVAVHVARMVQRWRKHTSDVGGALAAWMEEHPRSASPPGACSAVPRPPLHPPPPPPCRLDLNLIRAGPLSFFVRRWWSRATKTTTSATSSPWSPHAARRRCGSPAARRVDGRATVGGTVGRTVGEGGGGGGR